MGWIGVEREQYHPARKGADFTWSFVVILCITSERRQVVNEKSDATSGILTDWNSIDWARANQIVRRLQVRITKAVCNVTVYCRHPNNMGCLQEA